MAKSMRALFARREIPNEVISLRNSLANHLEGTQIGLREAHTRFKRPAEGSGFARGCHKRFSKELDVLNITLDPFADLSATKDLGFVIPEWVSVDDRETRTVEGLLVKSKITHKDFPPRPWHVYYDWNFFVRVDPQYEYLLAPYNIVHKNSVLECEWDTGVFPGVAEQEAGDPILIWPQVGDRIWMVGRWIYDCGHPCEPEKDHPPDRIFHGHRTEIHPPKAMAFFRPGAAVFPGNAGPTRANNAVLYVQRDGGYFRQRINDQDYAFDLYLPPRPDPAAVPLFTFRPLPGHSLAVDPLVTPFPAHDPRALRIVVPLKGVKPHPNDYAAIISGGWSDPAGAESVNIKSLRVTLESLVVTAVHAQDSRKVEEWHVYIGVNGVWRVRQVDVRLGETVPLNLTVDLKLHLDDRIHVTACGFEADVAHELMGKSSGFTWEEISDPKLSEEDRSEIMETVVEQGLDKNFIGIPGRDVANENEALGLFSQVHRVRQIPSGGTKVNELSSDRGDYKLNYAIDLL